LETRLLIGGEQVAGDGGSLDVELPAAPARVEGRAGDRGGEHGGGEAVRAHTAVHVPVDSLDEAIAAPFGGMKQSGFGRELGQEGRGAFQETKHVHIETKSGLKDRWYPYG